MAEILRFGKMNCCYLLKGREGSILIDTGLPTMRQRLYRALREQNLRLILLTHGHADHVGNAAYLSRMLGAPIAMHIEDYPLLTAMASRELHADTRVGKLIRAFAGGAKLQSPFEPDFYLQEGDSLAEYGVDATVHELPGHTQGSIGVLTAGGAYFVGDAIMNIGGGPPEAKLYENKTAMQLSVRRILDSAARTIYVGHGAPLKNSGRAGDMEA